MTPQGYAEVIGDPVAQSRSPAIHLYWLEKVGLAFDYRAARITRANLPDYLANRRADPDWRGCNVTMPLKLDAVLLADDPGDRAVAAGAANLLVPRDGRIRAGNTDVGAILRLLGPRLEQGAADGVTLLGNGGAARAVLVALRMLGIANVRIQARDLSAALKLAVEFGLEDAPRPFDLPVDSGGLINATPLGMAGLDAVAIDIARMPPGGWVFDMVTDPNQTPLLCAARASGLEVIDGLSMLVEQATESFKILFGQQAPRQYDEALMARLRGPE